MLQSADQAGVPVLGICFGGQMLATAHGGRVHATPAPEIGWHLVHGDDPGLDGAWFQWHYDRWVTPPEAVEVARNAAASQAFVLRRNLALQFHPEVDAASIKGWLEYGGRQMALDAGLDPDVILAQTEALEADAAARARRLVDAFLDRVAVAPDQEVM